jgi:hypothetical protein
MVGHSLLLFTVYGLQFTVIDLIELCGTYEHKERFSISRYPGLGPWKWIE